MAPYLRFTLVALIIAIVTITATSRNAKISKLLESDQWTDCIFLVGTGSKQSYIKAHRVILSMASPVLATMLYDPDDGSNILCPRSANSCQINSRPKLCGIEPEDATILTDIESDTFTNLLKFIYNEDIYLESFEMASKLAEATKIYQVPQLEDTCVSYLLSSTDTNNVGKAYELGKSLGNDKLLQKSIELFQNETWSIVNNKNSINMDIDTVITLLDQDTMNINSEVELFKALDLYYKAQSFRKKSSSKTNSTIYDAVKKIRFLTFSVEEFLNGPAYSGLLSKDQSSTILDKLISPNENLKMPEGFSTSTVRRKRVQQTNLLNVMYCTRTFIQESTWTYYPNFWYTVRFKVDTSICIIGAEFNTQIGIFGDSYEEDIKARVSNAYNYKELNIGEIKKDVLYNRMIEVYFDKPYCVDKDREYNIDIYFFKFGVYPKGKSSTTVKVDNITFEFLYPTTVGNSLLKSILYTHNM